MSDLLYSEFDLMSEVNSGAVTGNDEGTNPEMETRGLFGPSKKELAKQIEEGKKMQMYLAIGGAVLALLLFLKK